MKNKKSPKKIIESVKNPELESAYLKFPGEEMIGAYRHRSERSVGKDYVVLGDALEKGKKNYSSLHTHPDYVVLPSDKDFIEFLGDEYMKNMWIAQTNRETGKLQGYFVMRKTKKTPNIISELKKDSRYKGSKIPGLKHLPPTANSIASDEVENEYKKFNEGLESYSYIYEALVNLAEKFSLKYRFIPAKGLELSEDKTHFKEKIGGLEKTLNILLLLISIILMFLGLSFLSLNLTGYIILEKVFGDRNTFGFILIGSGGILFYWYFRRMLNNKNARRLFQNKS